MTGDDELFADLQNLVTPPQRQPPPESVAALHAAVARKFSGTPKRPWRQKVIAGAAVFGVVTGVPAAAFGISGTPLPDPLRTAIHAIGLPVDSVPVADIKKAEGDLSHALHDRDPAAITEAANHLEDCLADLDRADRTRLGPRADSLLAVAGMVAGTNDRQGVSEGPSSTQGITEGAINTGDGDGRSGDGSSSSSDTTVEGGTASSTGSGSDGDHTTTTTDAPAQTQTEGGTDTVTTTTVQSGGGGSDGGSGSASSDGGDSTTTTTPDQSH